MVPVPLTEAQWFSFINYSRMLNDVKRQWNAGRSRPGKRKLRLFACGSCRTLLWHLTVPEEFRRVVVLAEQLADDQSSKPPTITGLYNLLPKPMHGSAWCAAYAMHQTTLRSAGAAARSTAQYLVYALHEDGPRKVKQHLRSEERRVG